MLVCRGCGRAEGGLGRGWGGLGRAKVVDEGWGVLGEGLGEGGKERGTKIRNHGMSPPEAKKTLRNRGTGGPFCFLNGRVSL